MSILGLPIPGRNLLTAGGVSETPHTPFGPRGLTITKSAQRWTGSLALTRALYIIHASCTAKGWNRWDHNINSRHESNITTRIRVKIQIITHRGHWPNSTSRSGNQHRMFDTARSKRSKSPSDKQGSQLFLLSQTADWELQATRQRQRRNHLEYLWPRALHI